MNENEGTAPATDHSHSTEAEARPAENTQSGTQTAASYADQRKAEMDLAEKSRVQPGEEPAKEPETVTGFAAFRLWINRRIRQLARPPILKYQNQDWTVTELTANCELRLEHNEGHFSLIPFDERVIPQVLEQLL